MPRFRDRENQPTFELACRFTGRETDNAIQIHDAASKEDIWIPISQVIESHFNKQTGYGTIIMTEWIARQKGLIK